MKKNIFLMTILIVGCVLTNELYAQSPSPREKKSEEIIIRQNGDKENKMTIQVDGDSITVNGKPLSEYHDGDVTIMKRDLRDRRSNNFLPAPDNKTMNLQLFQDDDENDAPHAFLGVITDKADEGVKIGDVVKGTPAEKAGLLKGDVITKLDDKTISSPEDLMDAVKSHKSGDEVNLYYLRDKKKKDAKIKLGETKAHTQVSVYKNFNPGYGSNSFNFKTPEIPPMPRMRNNFYNFRFNNDSKSKLGLKIEDTENDNGVRILNVEEGSPADKAGLKKDDIITTFNDEKVNSVDELMDQVNDSEDKSSMNIKAMRNNSEMNFEVKIPKKLNSADL
ncbi:MAG TPA: PDZ domain-containing protein [Ginsengibacter sp.]